MKWITAVIAGLALAVVPAVCSAATVTLTTTDSIGTSSLNTAGNWSNGLPPAAGNDYQVSLQWLRTPTSGDHVFAGDSLSINTGGGMINKGGGSQTVTVNLILNGGIVRSGSGPGDTFILAGTIDVPASVTGGLVPDQTPYVISSSVTGSGTLHLANDASELGYAPSGPGQGIDFTGTSTFTGDVTANASDMVWADGSVWPFVIGASGVNNAVAGTGDATFNGAFAFDLTGASTGAGDRWQIAAVTSQTFGATFSVQGFTDHGDGTWLSASGEYEFDEATGFLSVYTPPTIEIYSVAPQGAEAFPEVVVEAVVLDGTSQVDTHSIVLTFDGMDVTGSSVIDSSGGTTAVSYAAGALPAASVHTGSVVVAGTNPVTDPITNEWLFTVADYQELPADWAYSLSATSSADRGFYYRDVMYDDNLAPDSILPNTEARAVAQLAGRLVNPVTGAAYTPADDTSDDEAIYGSGEFFLLPEDYDFIYSESFGTRLEVINYDNGVGDSLSGPGGNFYETNSPPYDVEEGLFPGIFFGFFDFADETIGCLELEPGFYTLGVNSDDGFVFYLGDQPRDLFAPDLGRFDGGRPAADTLFTVQVTQAGLYPFRLLHYQGGGGAALELFTVEPDGTRVLVNDDIYGGVRAWRLSSDGARPYVRWIQPQEGTIAATPNHEVTVEIRDGDTATLSSYSLLLEGAPVAASSSKDGDVTSVVYSGGLAFNTNHNFTLIYSDGSGSWTNDFTVETGDPSDAIQFVSFAPEGGGAVNPITLEVVIADGVSQVDTGSIQLFLDGVLQTSPSISSGSGETTVTKYIGPLTAGTTHTGMVVVAGINPAVPAITNQWTFTVEGALQVGEWYLVDNFEAYSAGEVDAVASPPWTEIVGTSFCDITDDGSSRRLSTGGWVDPYGRGAWRALDTVVQTPDGSRGLYYFQFQERNANPANATNAWVGFSRVTSAGSLTPQPAALDAMDVVLTVRDGGSLDYQLLAMDFTNEVVVADLNAGDWVAVWVDIDNAADTYDVYYQYTPAGRDDRSQYSRLDYALSGPSGLAFANGAVAAPVATMAVMGDADWVDLDEIWFSETAVVEVADVNVLSAAPTGITFDATPELQVVLQDYGITVDTNAVTLLLDGSPVTPDSVSKAGTTTTVSYLSAPLVPGAHSAGVIAGPGTQTNVWSFNVVVAAPAESNLLFNVNIAGQAGGVQRPVSDGIVVKAPSSGLNLWNNLAGNNGAVNTFAITDADGVYAISLETSGSHNWGENTEFVFPEMFQGWCGANAPMNMATEISGLHPSAAYDIYLYSTWRWTQNTVEYEIVAGTADVTTGSVTEVQANVQDDAFDDYSGLVYGENYIVFTGVTPTVDGRIVFTGVCPDGIMSGLQIVQKPGQGDPADVAILSTAPTGVTYDDAPVLQVLVQDFGATVNPGDVVLLLDGGAVAPSVVKVGPTTTVSYAASGLALGMHTAGVVPVIGGETNQWSFTVAAAPAASADVLYSINFAGNSGNFSNVANGTVIAAPSAGANQWNNLVNPAAANDWDPASPLTILDSDGLTSIGLDWTGETGHHSRNANPSDVLFQGYFGQGSFDGTLEITGLDPGAGYDLYVYFTWGWNENPVDYSIVEGAGALTSQALVPEQDNVTGGAGDYAGMVEGENYVIFTSLSPSSSGDLRLRAQSTDGGFSGLQLVQVPGPAGPTLSLEPSGEAGVIRFSWPTEFGSGFLVETNADLPVLENWNDAGLTPFTDGGNYVITGGMDEATMNYRLVEP